jgi:asparagine synthase (glutamine-hydrolysing)
MEYTFDQIKVVLSERFYKNDANKDNIVFGTGHIFVDGEVLTDQSMVDFLMENFNKNDISGFLKSVDGHYAIILKKESSFILIVDRIRSIPMFFCSFGDNIFISDKAKNIEKLIQGTPDGVGLAGVKLIGSATEDRTLINEIKQVKTGYFCEIVFLRNKWNVKKQEEYFNYKKDTTFTEDIDELLKKTDEIFLSVFKQLIQYANGDKIIVPLSGGLDSRLIVYMLHRLKYKNVLCFTYGKPGNWESEISKQVAERCGYEWKMIPYSRDMWNSFIKSNEAQQYFEYGSDLSSLALFQDFSAVKELKKTIPENSIFVPGLSADYLAGSQIPDILISQSICDKEIVVNTLLDTYCSTIPHKEIAEDDYAKLKESVKRNIEDVTNPLDCAVEYENWFYKEKLGKYVVNSVRAYDFFGFRWTLPFYYLDLLEFWKNLELDMLHNKKLYLLYLQNRFLFENIKYKPKNSNLKKQARQFGIYKKLKNTKKTIKTLKKILLDYFTHPMQWYGVFNNYIEYLIFSKRNYHRNTSLSLRYIAFLIQHFYPSNQN